jgi:hypothetical protein
MFRFPDWLTAYGQITLTFHASEQRLQRFRSMGSEYHAGSLGLTAPRRWFRKIFPDIRQLIGSSFCSFFDDQT